MIQTNSVCDRHEWTIGAIKDHQNKWYSNDIKIHNGKK